MYALVDCNNFYASCERVFRPDLANRPIAVLSNNDGCIIARSEEVKALGVKMGTPYFKALPQLKRHRVAVFSSNYALYGDMSQRVMNCLRAFTPQVEVYSIDEAFLDLSQFGDLDLVQYGQRIRQRIKQYLGLPVAVGIAGTKTLAKLANHIAKKIEGSGVCLLTPDSPAFAHLEYLPVGEIWGVGRRWQKRLGQMGIHTVNDFYRAPRGYIHQQFGIVGKRIHAELHGLPCLPLEQVMPRQNILTSRSFGTEIDKLSELQQALASFALIAAEKLRRQHSYTQSVYVFLHTNPFKPHAPQYHNGMAMPLAQPTQDSREIIRLAERCLRRLYRAGYRYQKVGIMLQDLVDKTQRCDDLFEQASSRQADTLMSLMDRINQQYGRHTTFIARQGRVDTPQQWQMKQQLLSPRYTTRWHELVTVR